MRLKGKAAIVTGAAGGLGLLYAERLAAEGAGVTVCDIAGCADTAAAIESAGGQALPLRTDVTSAQSTSDMARKTAERFGRIDILVNNAAIYAGIVRKPFVQITPEEWDRLMAVNLKGLLLCCQAVFPYMKQQGQGKIINISSDTTYQGVPFMLHYVTSKGGVIGFTRALARELGEYNIKVNAVAPGLVMTQASRDMVTPVVLETVGRQSCFRRPAQPEDLPGTVAFLASDDSDFITGQVLLVNGGAYMH